MNTHLSIALHVLTLLARSPGGLTSEALAAELGTNPVFLRRVLRSLKGAEVIHMRRGARGGITLAREADDITVDEVYRLVMADRVMLPTHSAAPSDPIPATIQALFSDAESRAVRYLGRFSIRDLAEDASA